MRKVFTELDPVLVSLFVFVDKTLCANTGGFIGVIAAATIIIAAKVIVSFVVRCFIIYQKWRYDLPNITATKDARNENYVQILTISW